MIGATNLLVAVLLAFAGVAASAADVQFRTAKLEASDPDTMISGQLFRPDGTGPFPAVVLLHTCGGLQQHMTHDWPQFLTGLGYVALAVDTLGPRGYHKGCGPMGSNRNEVQARDAYGALDYLAAQSFVDPNRIAAMGYSMGAITINDVILVRPTRAAGQREFTAYASFYGNCRKMKSGVVRNVPLLQVIAEKDERLAPSCIEAAKSVKMEAHVLPGVHHGFDHPQITQARADRSGNMMLYDADAVRKAQELVREFLARHLK
jgi:dienelactone hydrolase